MKKILITSMVAASMMFVGCGSSSSDETTPAVVVPENNSVIPENNSTTPENNSTTTVDQNETTTPEVILGTTVIDGVRFENLDETSIRASYDNAIKYCEALDGDGSWTLPTKDQLLLLLSGDDKVINETVIPKFAPDPDKPNETTHTSAIWSSSISINTDNNTSDPDFRDVLFLGTREIITENVVNVPADGPVEYYTICVKKANDTN